MRERSLSRTMTDLPNSLSRLIDNRRRSRKHNRSLRVSRVSCKRVLSWPYLFNLAIGSILRWSARRRWWNGLLACDSSGADGAVFCHDVGWEIFFAVWTGDFAVRTIFEVSIQLGHSLLITAQMAREPLLLLLLLLLLGLAFAAFDFLIFFALQLFLTSLLLSILLPAHSLGCALSLVNIEVGGGNDSFAGGTS